MGRHQRFDRPELSEGLSEGVAVPAGLDFDKARTEAAITEVILDRSIAIR
jgi:hypothetical protein